MKRKLGAPVRARLKRELHQKLARIELNVTKVHLYTSVLATGIFLKTQCPRGSAFVIGEGRGKAVKTGTERVLVLRSLLAKHGSF